MKRLTLAVVLSLIAAVGIIPCCITQSSAAAATSPKTATTNLHIEGMTCGSCATAVKLVLQKTPGVTAQRVSYEEKKAVVTYDASKTTPAKIAAAAADALTYKVTVMVTVDDSTAPAPKPKMPGPSCAVPV